MKILGFIRVGDKTECGGTVVEGDETAVSHGRAYTFQGARVDCRKHCVIADGVARAVLTGGRPRVVHGMKTSGGCVCESTLNDVDGVGSDVV